MKIEIDLSDIFHDEDGFPAETLNESIKRQVIDSISASTKAEVIKQINAQVNRVIQEELQAAVKDKMPSIVDDMINSEYTPVSQYGNRSEPTTFRNELLKSIQSQMVYKSTRYSNDKNAFTKTIDDLVEEKLKEFRTLFVKEVDTKFIDDAMRYATTKFAERLNVKL